MQVKLLNNLNNWNIKALSQAVNASCTTPQAPDFQLNGRYKLTAALQGLLVLLVLGLGGPPAWRIAARTYGDLKARQWWRQTLAAGHDTTLPGQPTAWIDAPQAELHSLILHQATQQNLHQFPCISTRGDIAAGTGLKIVQGHRDAHFNRLGYLLLGDKITWESSAGRKNYHVANVEIVTATNLETRFEREDPKKDRIALVTCYPFRYVGPAPMRYIVWLE